MAVKVKKLTEDKRKTSGGIGYTKTSTNLRTGKKTTTTGRTTPITKNEFTSGAKMKRTSKPIKKK